MYCLLDKGKSSSKTKHASIFFRLRLFSSTYIHITAAGMASVHEISGKGLLTNCIISESRENRWQLWWTMIFFSCFIHNFVICIVWWCGGRKVGSSMYVYVDMGYESQKYRLFSPALGNFFSDPKGVIESWRRQTFGFQKEEPKRVGFEIGIGGLIFRPPKNSLYHCYQTGGLLQLHYVWFSQFYWHFEILNRKMDY